MQYESKNEKPPYILTEIDRLEMINKEFLRTPASYTRVCKEIIINQELSKTGRQRVLVDRRSFIAHILITKGLNTLTYTGKILNQYHGTILHHVRRVQDLEKDPEYKRNTADLKAFFDSNLSQLNEIKTLTYAVSITAYIEQIDDLDAVRRAIQVTDKIGEITGARAVFTEIVEQDKGQRVRAVEIADNLNIIFSENQK